MILKNKKVTLPSCESINLKPALSQPSAGLINSNYMLGSQITITKSHISLPNTPSLKQNQIYEERQKRLEFLRKKAYIINNRSSTKNLRSQRRIERLALQDEAGQAIIDITERENKKI